MTFKSLGVHRTLLPVLKLLGFENPTPIQEELIPTVLKGRDALGISKTGSGKTASYVLPILTNLQKNPPRQKDRQIAVLVLVPTRELAVQVQQVFYDFGSVFSRSVKSLAAYGGVSINPQMKGLYGVQVLVATPGRLLELARQSAVEFGALKVLVLDEADKMLNMGFKEEMKQIIQLIPSKRQNILLSATLSPDLEALQKMVSGYVIAKPEKEDSPDVSTIEQLGFFVTEERKGPLLRYLIKEKSMTPALVFASSGQKADRIADKLRKNGVEAESIHGKKSQGARQGSLKRFRQGELPVLVTTDLLSRGIDIENLPFVINYELPRSPKDFVHRIGRTGRAEKSGKAISLINPEEVQHFKMILKKLQVFIDIEQSDDIDLHGF